MMGMGMEGNGFVIFGGETADGVYSDELWMYDKAAWSLICGGGGQCCGPAGTADGHLSWHGEGGSLWCGGGVTASGRSDAS